MSHGRAFYVTLNHFEFGRQARFVYYFGRRCPANDLLCGPGLSFSYAFLRFPMALFAQKLLPRVVATQ